MPLGPSNAFSATSQGTTPVWLDAASNWVTLVDLVDVRNGRLCDDATVTCTVTSVNGPLTTGPLPMAPVVDQPGTYGRTILDSRFRVDSAVRVVITAVTPDGAQGSFVQTLRVVAV